MRIETTNQLMASLFPARRYYNQELNFHFVGKMREILYT
jgi:hypothetical protein